MKMALKNILTRIATCVLFAKAVEAAATATPPVVNLGYATYQGVVNAATNNTQFLGIRYAASPTGTLRWAEPQNPATTPGVQLANAQPNSCLGAGSGNAATTPFRTSGGASSLSKRASPSEDCLFLNVFLPGQLGSKSKLPVVFWIHGGGYAAGSAAGFDGNDLIREAGGGVVVVVIQYRLGLFGFLPGQNVKAGGALNAGLLDQQFALRWVQQHISLFGGDPQKVTIWGESAGAGSVLQHIVANGGRTNPPLFNAAITSSTFLPSQYNFNDTIPETLYSETVAQSNCSSSANTLNCLRAADVNVLQAANSRISQSGFFGTFVFVPVVDGSFSTERPTELLKQGRVNGERFLAMTNTFEGVAFVNQNTAATLNIPTYVSQLFPKFASSNIAAAAAQYQSLGTPIFQANAIMGESIFICPTYFLLRAFNGRSFKGEFAIPPGGHGMDIAYYFPGGATPPFNNTAFDTAFPESFLNFAMSHDPNIKWDPSNITPTWGLWNGGTEMLFNKTTTNQADIRSIRTSTALLQRCNFWEGVGGLTAQ